MEEIKYLSSCPQLPLTAPVGHPHLVDLSSVDLEYPYPQPGLGIADMVVTTLFNHNPQTLQRFLDLSHDFKFQRHHKSERGNLDFCIVREGTTVTCGYLTESQMRRIQLWDSQHVYRMQDGPAGRWIPVIWKAWPGLQNTTEREILEMGGLAAKDPLTGYVWEESDAVEMVVADSCEI